MKQRKSTTSTSPPPASAPQPHRPKRFYKCLPVIASIMANLKFVRRQHVYPEYYHNQDDAYKRMTRTKLPFKTALLATFLLTLGAVMLGMGIHWYLTSHHTEKSEVRKQGGKEGKRNVNLH